MSFIKTASFREKIAKNRERASMKERDRVNRLNARRREEKTTAEFFQMQQGLSEICKSES